MPKPKSRPSRRPAAAVPAAAAPRPGAKPSGKRTGEPTGRGSGALLLVAGLLALGGAVFFISAFEDDTTETAAAISYDTPAAEATQAAVKTFPYYDSADEAKPFPVTLPPSSYSNETLQHAYALAKEIPEVLVQLPCLCGCHMQAEDHGSLLDCYVDDHAAT